MKELKVALIGGGGFMGKAHSLAWAVSGIMTDLGARVVKEVLVDVDPGVAAEAATKLAWNSSSADWSEAVNRDDIDIVDITTPPQYHEEIALAAIAAGKHVLVEKPITNDADAAHRMWKAARDAGVVAQVGFNYRNSQALQYMKHVIDSGELGPPVAFRGKYLMGFVMKDRSKSGWRSYRSKGSSGSSGDLGSHIIDMAEFLCGPIVRVSSLAIARDPGNERGFSRAAELTENDQTDDAVVVIGEFANGALATFSMGTLSHGYKNHLAFELDAAAGGFRWNWNRREEIQITRTSDPNRESGFKTVYTHGEHGSTWSDLAGLGTGYIDASAVQTQALVKAIVMGATPGPSFAEGAHVQQVVEAIQKSSEIGQWVTVASTEAMAS